MPSISTSDNENCMSITSALEAILPHPSLLYNHIISINLVNGHFETLLQRKIKLLLNIRAAFEVQGVLSGFPLQIVQPHFKGC